VGVGPREVEGKGETGRRGDGETGRYGDGEIWRRGDGETGRRGDGETGCEGGRSASEQAGGTEPGTESGTELDLGHPFITSEEVNFNTGCCFDHQRPGRLLSTPPLLPSSNLHHLPDRPTLCRVR